MWRRTLIKYYKNEKLFWSCQMYIICFEHRYSKVNFYTWSWSITKLKNEGRIFCPFDSDTVSWIPCVILTYQYRLYLCSWILKYWDTFFTRKKTEFSDANDSSLFISCGISFYISWILNKYNVLLFYLFRYLFILEEHICNFIKTWSKYRERESNFFTSF